jgi:hypothetical protein
MSGYYQGAFCKNAYSITVLAAMHANATMALAITIAIATALPRFRGGCTCLNSESSSLIKVSFKTAPRYFRHFFGRQPLRGLAKVGREGLEPSKAEPADLQSAPFAARDTDPRLLDARYWEPAHRANACSRPPATSVLY